MEINGKSYNLKFNMKRIKLIEKDLGGESITHALLRDNGMMSLTALETYFKYGLIEDGADAFVAPDKAVELCEEFMQANGYAAAVVLVQKQMETDLGFLFRAN